MPTTLFCVEYLHTPTQQNASWELYATNKAEAILSAKELLPPSYKITNVYPAPMFSDDD